MKKPKDEQRHVQSNKMKWDKWADSLDSKGWKYDYLRDAQSKLISLLDVKENIHFLDVGYRTGWAVGEAAKLVDYKGMFYGVDLSPRMIEKAKSNFRGKDNFHFIQVNSESIPLNDDFLTSSFAPTRSITFCIRIRHCMRCIVC